MTHIRRFLESNQSYHSRLSVEEIEDFFLEFIQAGDIHFYASGIPIGQNYVAVYFILDTKFNSITDSNSMSRLTQLLDCISDVCTRWKLDWEFKLRAIGNKPGGGGPMQTQLEIRQPVPQIVLDQFPDITTPHFDIHYVKIPEGIIQFSGPVVDHSYRFNMWLKHDELTMDFYIVFEPMFSRGGSGANGKWLKDDWVRMSRYESDIINKLQQEYSKRVPCQYIGKELSNRNLYYGMNLFKYKFKLLV